MEGREEAHSYKQSWRLYIAAGCSGVGQGAVIASLNMFSAIAISSPVNELSPWVVAESWEAASLVSSMPQLGGFYFYWVESSTAEHLVINSANLVNFW